MRARLSFIAGGTEQARSPAAVAVELNKALGDELVQGSLDSPRRDLESDAPADGREQGHHEAALEMLQRVLAHRFGAEAQTLAADLTRYDVPTLERLLDAALDSVTLGDFRAGLPPIASPS